MSVPNRSADIMRSWPTELALDNRFAARRWSERVYAGTAEVIAKYATGDVAGYPAITRRTVGDNGED